MAGVLNVSEAASLALHAAVYLAGRRGERQPTRSIAALLGCSEAHLAKVLARLERAGLVRAKRGPSGGYELRRDPGRVSLKEVYEAIEGPLEAAGCLFGLPVCGGRCILGDLAGEVDSKVRTRLSRTRLSDLAATFGVAAGGRKGGRKWSRGGTSSGSTGKGATAAAGASRTARRGRSRS